MNYGMFSQAGNDAVELIVDTAIINDSAWLEVYQQLVYLSKVEVFAEATDTAVREAVYSELYANEKV